MPNRNDPSVNRPGCCVDKSCNHATCMTLPEDESCGTCKSHPRCQKMFGAKADNTTCDFFPRRFFPVLTGTP